MGSSYAQDVYGPEFPDTVATLVSAGYYWSAHTKTEVEVGWRDRSDQYDTDPACPLIGGTIRCDLSAPGPVEFLTHSYQMRRVSLAQLYQFRRDARFQPYVGVGMSLQYEREYDGRIESAASRTPPVAGPQGPGPAHSGQASGRLRGPAFRSTCRIGCSSSLNCGSATPNAGPSNSAWG
jgi:hypothetical protein